MLKKTFKFVDYNGNPRTEDHYFNLTQAEVTELELSVDGGLTAMINRVVQAMLWSRPTVWKQRRLHR